MDWDVIRLPLHGKNVTKIPAVLIGVVILAGAGSIGVATGWAWFITHRDAEDRLVEWLMDNLWTLLWFPTSWLALLVTCASALLVSAPRAPFLKSLVVSFSAATGTNLGLLAAADFDVFNLGRMESVGHELVMGFYGSLIFVVVALIPVFLCAVTAHKGRNTLLFAITAAVGWSVTWMLMGSLTVSINNRNEPSLQDIATLLSARPAGACIWIGALVWMVRGDSPDV